jgi:hypothetical protein
MGIMGWDNDLEWYPRTKKDTLHLSFKFISFGISHSRFSDFGISFLDLGYLFQVFWIWDIRVPGISQKPPSQNLLKRYPGPWDIKHLVISLAYP